ncbi:YigZ family protein [Bifidobacterium tsurumiense]|uniref:YigZ family protein n=1 Tax=Bifidobacterium tsurumiense TaxID=356829 RepID=UPI0012B2A181|nr:YigZ family protein [Bifidobacterium tsurumiense]MDY4677844.1 YigZ family protein [Bifidobacterium tsurumiense]MSS12353.1 YigZ family protein [Bifidobacterium tsurumiense]
MADLITLLDTAKAPAHAAFVEKKSEFIGDACHIDSLEEAVAFVESIREQHPKARHVAYAAICGGDDGRLSERMSDDGEPSGTAGKPILDVIRANGLTDCVVTVTRYFGGILLGAGGLIRAYASGAAQAISVAHKADIVVCDRYGLTVDYSQLGALQQLLATVGAEQDSSEYTDRVSLEVVVPVAQTELFNTRLQEMFNATVRARHLGTSHVAKASQR